MTELIRRQDAELILAREMYATSLEGGCDPVSPMDFLPEARAWMSDAPTAYGWIPCSERLPEEEGWYLVTIQNDKTRKRRTENDLFAIGIAEAHKHTPYKFCKDGHRQTVIAWMPIPEPYKAESEEI